jgi:hypothetical protein
MKVLDLRCGAGHGFEGWFASESDYEQQRVDGRIECPLCGDAAIARRPSAPRLNLSGARAPQGEGAQEPSAAEQARQQQAAARWTQAVEALVRETEDVGERFPEEARRIHYGEVPSKGIRGQATAAQRADLLEEGIETVALPMVGPAKRSLQ